MNYVRLSKANVESPTYPLRDGDLIQLGHGEPTRAGKISTHSFVVRIESSDPGRSGTEISESPKICTKEVNCNVGGKRSSAVCSICSTSILQSQASLTAPCNHMWHRKCMFRIMEATSPGGFSCPGFSCPLCLERRLSVIAVKSSFTMRGGRHLRVSGRHFLTSMLRRRIDINSR